MLIADDERIVREAVAELIDWESMDIQIVGLCRNGLEALDVIMDAAPDIVMTDIKMPGMDGLELIGKIHQIDQRIQFIILSGYQEFEFAKKAMQFGVRHYLLKPINEKQIIDAVQQIKQNFDDLQPPVERLAAQLVHQYGLPCAAITMRRSIHAQHNRIRALLLNQKQAYFSKEYDIHISDRVGSGDSFSGGLIYALLQGFFPSKAVEFAAAACCWAVARAVCAFCSAAW